ncbi:MAG TPA: phospholipid carrier-dependent glycosyltransferase, partial [Chloroflexota bacterium]
VSLLMGALVPVLTVLLVHELWPEDLALALLAGALVAVCGQLWQSSVVVMSDTTGLAVATFSAFALARYARGGSGAWLVLAGAAIAYATLARWIYGLVAIPFATYGLIVLIERSRRRRSSSAAQAHSASRIEPPAKAISPRTALVHAVAAVAVAALILVPAVAQPLIGLLRDPAQPATFAGNFQVYSWSPLNALRHDFFTADGHLAYSQPNGVYYALASANFAYFGPLLAVWILPGLWAAWRWRARDILLIVGWAAIVFVFHAGAPWQNFRFALAYLPPVAILAAAGLLLTWRWFDARGSDGVSLAADPAEHPHRTARVAVRAIVGVCVIVGLLSTAAAAARLVERFIDAKDQELALVHWVQSEAPANAELFTFGETLTFRHYTSMPTFDLFDVSASDVRDIVSDPAPHYLLVDVGSVESQWLNQAPSTNYHVLRDEVGLKELGTQGGYTLYQVDAPRDAKAAQ